MLSSLPASVLMILPAMDEDGASYCTAQESRGIQSFDDCAAEIERNSDRVFGVLLVIAVIVVIAILVYRKTQKDRHEEESATPAPSYLAPKPATEASQSTYHQQSPGGHDEPVATSVIVRGSTFYLTSVDLEDGRIGIVQSLRSGNGSWTHIDAIAGQPNQYNEMALPLHNGRHGGFRSSYYLSSDFDPVNEEPNFVLHELFVDGTWLATEGCALQPPAARFRESN